MAQDRLLKAEKVRQNTNIAKNVILFVGDGMGLSTVAGARILKGQLNGKSGEETVLTFEEFPYVALSKVLTTPALQSVGQIGGVFNLI